MRESPAVLTAYRIFAYLTGTLLLVLCLGVVLKYGFDHPQVVAVVGPIHGTAFIFYVLLSFWIYYRRRWSALRLIAVALAGTIPLMSFVAERRVVREGRGQPF